MSKRAEPNRNRLEQQVPREALEIESDVRSGRLQRSMAVITGFAAIVSGFESFTQHQRGHFSNRWMWTPVWLTPFMSVATGAALFSQRAARTLLPLTSLASLVDGVIGFGYHLRGIGRLPGGFKLGRYNIVIGPPIFAPLLISGVGILGVLASLFRREKFQPPERQPDQAHAPGRNLRASHPAESRPRELEEAVAHGRFQQGMALVTAFFAILSGGEAYFEHLRGSYNQKVMWTPVLLTPPMIAATVGSVRNPKIARKALPVLSAFTFLDGLVGFGLHLRGIKRMPGGFKNAGFNVTMGPPLFAPLLFTAVGLLGLIASFLRRR